MIEVEKFTKYLRYCQYQKKLSKKTVDAYKIDINQFIIYFKKINSIMLDRNNIETYIEYLCSKYKTTTVKRKYAAIKTYYSYLEYMEFIPTNPFNKVSLRIKEERILPRVFHLSTLEKLLCTSHAEANQANLSEYQQFVAIRNIAILELLFSTGLRVSELCDLTIENTDLSNQQILVKGKGSKERILYLSNSEVLSALKNYINIRANRKKNLLTYL